MVFSFLNQKTENQIPIAAQNSKENNVSILLASHNMNEVTRLCSSILMMKDGEIIDSGKPTDLISKHGRENLEEVFLKLAREKV